jgi:hypothetical protein
MPDSPTAPGSSPPLGVCLKNLSSGTCGHWIDKGLFGGLQSVRVGEEERTEIEIIVHKDYISNMYDVSHRKHRLLQQAFH